MPETIGRESGKIPRDNDKRYRETTLGNCSRYEKIIKDSGGCFENKANTSPAM
jgi:hypothetical protein